MNYCVATADSRKLTACWTQRQPFSLIRTQKPQYLWLAGCWNQINKIALSSFMPLWPREQNKHWEWTVWRVARQGVPESGLCKNSEYVNPQMRETLYYPWQSGHWLCEHNPLEGRLSSINSEFFSVSSHRQSQTLSFIHLKKKTALLRVFKCVIFVKHGLTFSEGSSRWWGCGSLQGVTLADYFWLILPRKNDWEQILIYDGVKIQDC